tara:strand:- start:548 stop:1153 length:606 start_codon:yes stop_codon:yes gene_type:complete
MTEKKAAATRKAPTKKAAPKKAPVKRAPRKPSTKPVKKSYIDDVFGRYVPNQAKAKAIAERYVIDWNPLEALKAGGYSEGTVRSHGHVMIKHPNIQAELAKLQEEIRANVIADAAYVIHGMHEVAEKCMGHQPIITLDEEGNSIVKLGFNPAAATAALEKIGRSLGMFKDSIEIKGVLSVEDWVAQVEEKARGANVGKTQH